MTGRFLTVAVLVLTASRVPAAAQGWPEFRGPTGQGISSEKNLPLEWSESRNILWKVPVAGLGWSSPSVAAGRVWLTTAVRESRGASLRALAFDEQTGELVVDAEIFKVRSANPKNPKNSLASPTPVVDGDRVYVHFGADGTAALDARTGQVIWKAQFSYESQHGSGGSPVLYKDLLVFSCDGSYDAFVVALDKNTGKVRWKTDRRRPADQAYTTPLVIRVGEHDQIVSVGAYRAVAYNPENGKEIWSVSYDEGFSNVPRPVYGHGLVYIATGFFTPALLAVRPDGSGDVTRSNIAWALRRAAPLTPSPLLVGDELYVVNDLGILSCLDAQKGTVYWQQRLGGNHSASPVFADGRIYFQSEEGVTTVIAPGREFRKLATSGLDGATLSSIAVADGSFFIRSNTHLYRIGLRQ